VGKGRLAPLVVLAVLVAATAYEAAIALEVVSAGDEPGEELFGRGLAFGAALLTLLGAAFWLAVLAARPSPPADALLASIDLAAAAFLVARFYSFDPYFAPTLRRFSEGGVAAPWVFAVVALALVAALLVRIRPRVGLGLTAPVLVLLALTAFATGLGH
jgi:hypothetical protein